MSTSQRRLGQLASDLAEVQSRLEVVATRLAAFSADERDRLEPRLISLRDRWNEAQFSYNVARATGGKLRDEDEQQCRAALDEVESGLIPLVSEVGH